MRTQRIYRCPSKTCRTGGSSPSPALRTLSIERLSCRSKRLPRPRSVLDVDYGDDYYQKIDIFLPTNEGLPTQLEDCFDALAWAYRNIEQHGGSPDRIFVGGHSSGAHLAALMGLRKDYAAARSRPVDVVKGCFPLSGPHNLHFDEVEPGSRREKLLGDFLARPGDDRQASPIDHVAGNQTPFFVAYGSKDVPAIIADNERLVSLLRDQTGTVETYVLEGIHALPDQRIVWRPEQRLGSQGSRVDGEQNLAFAGGLTETPSPWSRPRHVHYNKG